MIQERPAVLLLLCCTFPPPTNLVPAALKGLCMNFHCHIQGRAAQGQLIAFIIMISRQIYRACLKSADQGLWKMCLQLFARHILLFQSFFLTQFTRLEVNRWDLASSSSPSVYNFRTQSVKSPTECLFTAVKCSLNDWGMTQTRNPSFAFEPWNGVSPILICFRPDSMTLVWVTVLFSLFYCSFHNCKRLVFLFWCWLYIFFFLVLFEKEEKIKTSGAQISLHCGFGLMCAVGPDFWSRSPRGQIQQIYGRTSSHMKSPFLFF